MKKSAYRKDILMTVKKNLSRFIAITIMAALGIGMFSGFAVGCLDVFKSADIFYDEQNTYDIKIVSTLGLTKDDVDVLDAVEGISKVAGVKTFDVTAQKDESTDYEITLNAMPENKMNSPYVQEGRIPSEAGEIAVTKEFADVSGLKINDTIKVFDKTQDDDSDKSENSGSIATDSFVITGIVIDPVDFTNNNFSSTSVVDSVDGERYNMFVIGDVIEQDVYSAVYVNVDGADKLDSFSDKYKKLVEETGDYINDNIKEKQQNSRYDTLATEISDEIKDAIIAQYGEFVFNTEMGQTAYNSERDKALEMLEKPVWYVWNRYDNDCFSGLKSNTEFIQTVTKIFPVIFFVVAVLISLSTMTRMVEEDRGLIGTYKSLGYSNLAICMKYIWYATAACIIGGIVGTIIGAALLPYIVQYIMQTMFLIPRFTFGFFAEYEIGGIILCIFGIIGATIVSCIEMVSKRPAVLMRPKSPKAGKRIIIEYITPIWKRMKFLNKVTSRNLFRYKKRALMTILGIMGCTLLIVLGFGVKDTVLNLMPSQYGNITMYDAIVVSDDLSQDDKNALMKEWELSGRIDDMALIQISIMTLRYNGDSNDISVFVIPDDTNMDNFIHLYDYASTSNQGTELTDNGIVVTESAARLMNISDNAVVSLQDEDKKLANCNVSKVVSNHIGNFVYMKKSYYDTLFTKYNPQSYLLCINGDKDSKKEWLDSVELDERVLKVSSSQAAVDSFEDTNNLISMVVYLLVAMSAALALTVLFTLSNINVSERARELATIKVLGFTRKEVNAYVNKETIMLTLIGIVLGLPIGYLLTWWIMGNVNMAGITMQVQVSPWAYIIAAVLTLVFELFVEKLTNKTLTKINMAEALKSVE